MGISNKPHDDDGFVTLAQLESQRLRSGLHRSLGEDAKGECQETPRPRKPRKPRKRRCLTRSSEAVGWILIVLGREVLVNCRTE
jgi:hypothetical protein